MEGDPIPSQHQDICPEGHSQGCRRTESCTRLLTEPLKGIRYELLNMSFESNRQPLSHCLLIKWLLWCPNNSKHDISISCYKERERLFFEFQRPHRPLSFVDSCAHDNFAGVWCNHE